MDCRLLAIEAINEEKNIEQKKKNTKEKRNDWNLIPNRCELIVRWFHKAHKVTS